MMALRIYDALHGIGGRAGRTIAGTGRSGGAEASSASGAAGGTVSCHELAEKVVWRNTLGSSEAIGAFFQVLGDGFESHIVQLA